jgi:hypothetical protein
VYVVPRVDFALYKGRSKAAMKNSVLAITVSAAKCLCVCVLELTWASWGCRAAPLPTHHTANIQAPFQDIHKFLHIRLYNYKAYPGQI